MFSASALGRVGQGKWKRYPDVGRCKTGLKPGTKEFE
jgi:hypothetical protein